MSNDRLTFQRRLPSGSTYVLGRAHRHPEKGWKFYPNVQGRTPSRKFHPTLESCLPRWLGYPDHCESVRSVGPATEDVA